jgi:hypothetical protein
MHVDVAVGEGDAHGELLSSGLSDSRCGCLMQVNQVRGGEY